MTEPPVAPDDTPTRFPSEQVIEIDEDGKVHYPDELTELRAEVSRLQQENALFRRSLEMLPKQMDQDR
jgi:hypothetical protein